MGRPTGPRRETFQKSAEGVKVENLKKDDEEGGGGGGGG